MHHFFKRYLALTCIALALTACNTVSLKNPATGTSSTSTSSTSTSSSGTTNTEPNSQTVPPEKPVPTRDMRIGIAFGGGAAKGFAHIGVIRAFENNGIQVDVVAGTSAGSLVGAMYAQGATAGRLTQLALSMDEAVLADWTLSTRGAIKGEALQNYVNQAVGGVTMEKMRRPFIAVATDFQTGDAVYFQRGDTGMAVRASSSIPGVFQAVHIGNKVYVDGGLSSPVPALAARKLGADFVIAVDISSDPNATAPDSLAGMLAQTTAIMGLGLRQYELKTYADVVIKPAVQGIGGADFKARNDVIQIGERATLAKMQEIKDKIAAAKLRLNLR